MFPIKYILKLFPLYIYHTGNDDHINGAARKRHAQTTVANIDVLSRHTILKRLFEE